jgi:hypothetical protein
MIGLIFVALFQAAAGAPEAPAPTGGETAPPAAEAPAQSPSAKPEERLRCRREAITGTRLARRICTTVHEDQIIADESRDQLRRMQSELPALPSN